MAMEDICSTCRLDVFSERGRQISVTDFDGHHDLSSRSSWRNDDDDRCGVPIRFTAKELITPRREIKAKLSIAFCKA
jgi:hypothetical protein